MQIFSKELFRRFHELPENLTSKDYPFFVFINYAFFLAGIFHFVFIFVFAALGIKILSIYNVFSSLLWTFCIYLNLRGFDIAALLLANAEVLLHAFLCGAVLGWQSGFYYYILVVPLIIFLSNWPTAGKIALCAANAGAYLLLNHYLNMLAPVSGIDPAYVNLFNYLNSLSIIFIISYCAYYYRFIVLNVENKLEDEHQRTMQILSKLNKDLTDAADYVKTLLPEEIHEGPVHSSWQFIPSTSLGGDALGYHWLDKDNFAIYLLDVSGHGVGAALLSATIMNVLRSHALPQVDFCEPDQVLSGLNRSFPGEENNDMFFTIWYGVYNRSMGHLTYSSGGHPPALLFSDSRSEDCVQLRTPNCVVGGMKDATFRKDVQDLTGNSYLYVFSDGVYEFTQPDGSRWKYGEFVNYLRGVHCNGHEDLDKLVASVKNLNRSDVFEDDFTILEVAFL